MEMDPSRFGDEQFRVPKRPVAVEILVDGGRLIEGNLHVGLDAGPFGGRERIIDVLQAPGAFVPLTSRDAAYLLLKERMIWIRVQDPRDAGEDDGFAGCPEAEVEILLASVPPEYASLDGTVRLAMPPGRVRLLDFLNGAGPFFGLRTRGGSVLVNTRYVTELRQY